MWNDVQTIDPRFVYRRERTRHIAFPLGGIGAGGFAITGSGRLMDWSIRNRPGLQQFNGYSHFAVKVERDGKLVDARVLNGPYDGNPSGSPGARKVFDGFGHGANRNSMAGLPHFRDVTFIGRFPVADLIYADDRFPGTIRQTAFSPFVPHESRDSSMPVACFAFDIVNDTGDDLEYTLAATIGNYRTAQGTHRFETRDGISQLQLGTAGDLPPSERGDISISTNADRVEHTDYHFRGAWFDSASVYWREFARPGPLPVRHYDVPRSGDRPEQPEHATLGTRIAVPAGERRTVRFAVSWNYPDGDIYWYDPLVQGSADPRPTWRNFYATQWTDSRDSAREVFARWDELAGKTFAFRDSLFNSSLPPEIIDAATGTMALLRTATVIRLEGGELWGWEGLHTDEGSCQGSCTHVWNYQQAVPFLFPDLERSLRETELTYNQLPGGGLTFRQKLPLGSGFDVIGPCADGHWGAVIKMYRDWKIGGDTGWLQRYWPNLKRAIQYAWSDENPDEWDPERTGILWGRQHHTLDMELFGPNAWLSSMYVAALFGAAEMAAAVGDAEFSGECRKIASAGAKYIDEHLFNGAFYAQNIDLADRGAVARFADRAAGVLTAAGSDMYWSGEHGQLKYQFGRDACHIDQILGQWHADVAGLGEFLDRGHVEAALLAIYRHNHLSSMEDHVNPARVYGLEGEGGTLLCTWPAEDSQPMVPAPYSEEVWTGLEYAFASHLIMRGFVEEGLTCVRAARDRYDGRWRNPWNEIECGSYYARSMSAFALVNAYSGLRVDATRQALRFVPVVDGDYRLFWSAGTGWGELVRSGDAIGLKVIGGEIRLRELRFGDREAASLTEAITIAAGQSATFEASDRQLHFRGVA